MDKHQTATKHAFLSVKEAADYLHINPSTLYRLVKAGEAPAGAFRVGGQWRFDAAKLALWLSERGATGIARRMIELHASKVRKRS